MTYTAPKALLLRGENGPKLIMLEGMARSNITYDKDQRVERLLAVIKRATHMLNRKGGVTDIWTE